MWQCGLRQIKVISQQPTSRGVWNPPGSLMIRQISDVPLTAHKPSITVTTHHCTARLMNRLAGHGCLRLQDHLLTCLCRQP